MRRHPGVAVAGVLDHAAADREVGDLRRQELHARLGLRDVEVAALAGAPAVIERAQQRDDAETRPDIVGIGAVGPDRQLPRPADQLLETGERGADVAVARDGRIGAGLAHQRSAQHDQARIGLTQRLVAEAPALHLAGGERLHQHVRPAREVPCHLLPASRSQVERHAELARVAVLEQAGLLGVDLPAGERPHHTGGVDPQRGLDAHDGRAVVGEHPADDRPGHDPGQVQDLQSLERCGHRITPVERSAAISSAAMPSRPP